jgi:hypothetical protein
MIGNERCNGTGMNVGKNKLMRISRQPTAKQIAIDQKQQESAEYLSCFGSMITNGAICAWEIKCWIALAKFAFSNKKIFTSKLG